MVTDTDSQGLHWRGHGAQAEPGERGNGGGPGGPCRRLPQWGLAMAASPRAVATGSAADFIPARPTMSSLRAAAANCRGCHLYRYATQTVFGEGPRHAEVVMVGEQPGDQEDRQGHPFVGPSGRLLDEALVEAGIDRSTVYVTNAVKHFKFVRQELTRRRLHKKPAAGEVRACRPWLEEEVKVVRPALIIALGSTAAQSLLGPSFRVTRERGRVLKSPLGPVL